MYISQQLIAYKENRRIDLEGLKRALDLIGISFEAKQRASDIGEACFDREKVAVIWKYYTYANGIKLVENTLTVTSYGAELTEKNLRSSKVHAMRHRRPYSQLPDELKDKLKERYKWD